VQAIDFHTHAFPEFLAERAIATLEAETDNVKAFLDGTVGELLRSMDRAGIETSVICSIATTPAQVDSILKWSKEIASDRIVPFPSVHPETPRVKDKLREIRDEGFVGIKLHPMYQDFELDSPKVYEIYEGFVDAGLIFVPHCGYDIAFPGDLRASVPRIANVLERFPSLTLVATHTGGWKQWEQVWELLVGKDVYFETSFSIEDSTRELVKKIIATHGAEKVLFGTDSPWRDQSSEKALVRSLGLGEEAERKIFRGNAERLLGRHEV